MSYLNTVIKNVPTPGILLLSAILVLAGCSSTPDSTETASQDIYSNDEQIFVGDSIEMSYDPNVIMKRAESFFEKESYADAVVDYKHFLDLHQNHILAPYAQYKIGQSHYKQFRTVDRDPAPLKKSIAGFERLLKNFPASRYETEAKETIRTCKELLVERHLMVGEFYYSRGSYLAAAHRFQKIINDFPEVDTTGESMFRLAKTYQDLGIEEWTQDWLVALMEQYPESPYHSSAQSLLASLHEENPTLLASLPQNPILYEKVEIPQPPATPLPQLQDDGPAFANAGILPEDPATRETFPEITTENTVASATPCTIGSWCDSQFTPSVPTTAPSASSAASTKTCKAGDWC